MSKWKRVKVEDVSNILDAQRIPITASMRKSGLYPYYGANGIQDYVLDYIFDGEFVLVAEDGGNFGSKTKPIAYRVSGKCWVNNHAHILSAKSNINIDYLCYSLMFYDVSKIISGTTRAKLNQSALRKMEIPFPPLEEQHKIASTLDTVSEILKLRKQQLDELDLLVKSRFVEMFGDPIENPMNWEYVVLNDICNIGSSKRIYEYEYVTKGIPFYRTKEIVELSKGNSISTELFISNQRFNEIKSKYVVPKQNDILVSAVGTIGIIWVVDEREDFYFKDGNLLWIKSSDKFSSTYMRFLLENLIQHYKQELSSGTAYSALTIEKLKFMKAFNPPLELQNKFADFVKQVDSLKSEVQKSINETQTLFDSLMQEYFE